MADRSTFTPEEWNVLMQGVMAAGIAVTAAEPSGLWGMLKEGLASSRALLGAKEGTGATQLSTALVEGFERSEDRNAARDGLQARLQGVKKDEIKGKCIEAVREAAQVVDAKAPADAPGFKAWLLQISQSVAEAAKEGGFLGFGGTPVSDAEKATLAEISGALKVA